MTRYGIPLLILLAAFAASGEGQIKVGRVERLALARSHSWSHPQFSPTGSFIYFTDHDGNGIWEYSFKSQATRQLTSDPKSGFAFNISSDGKNLIYRRTLPDRAGRSRQQDVVLMNLARQSSAVLDSGPDVSIPAFANNAPVYSLQTRTMGLTRTAGAVDVTVLGIENTKIALSVNGNKTLLDPLGNGSYIWPVLSPDKRQLVAYETDRGAFVCDLTGAVLSRLGRRDAPSWTKSGKWIIYMEDKDDGHQLLSSDIFAVTPDGKAVVQLTSTREIFEMYPQCSPTENKIVCSTTDGVIMILEYEER